MEDLEQRLVWLRRPIREWHSLPHWRQIQFVPCPAPWFCWFRDYLFASACWTRDSSNWERPWCTACLQAERSDVNVSHLLSSIPKAFRSRLQISLYLSCGLLLGQFPCTNSPYRRSFGIQPSAILMTCLSQCRCHCFSNVYMLKNSAHSRTTLFGTLSIDLDLGICHQLLIKPYSLCESREYGSLFANVFIQLNI